MASFPVLKSRRHCTTWIDCRGAGVVQVVERGDFEPADLFAVVGVVVGAVPERDVPPGQLPGLGIHAGLVLIHDSHVASAAADQVGPLIMLGMQRVGGHHRVLQI